MGIKRGSELVGGCEKWTMGISFGPQNECQNSKRDWTIGPLNEMQHSSQVS